MEHIFFGVQLCIEISIFIESCEICYIYHPALATGLQDPMLANLEKVDPHIAIIIFKKHLLTILHV